MKVGHLVTTKPGIFYVFLSHGKVYRVLRADSAFNLGVVDVRADDGEQRTYLSADLLLYEPTITEYVELFV